MCVCVLTESSIWLVVGGGDEKMMRRTVSGGENEVEWMGKDTKWNG